MLATAGNWLMIGRPVYPQLSDWYEKKGDEWSAQKKRAQAAEMEAEELEEERWRAEQEMADA